MYGIVIKTNESHSKKLAEILSPTSSFVGVARGKFYMETATEAQAHMVADYLISSRLLPAERVSLVGMEA